ncbi:DNA-3-methyladenine glycosylase 2 [Halopseudomonas sabulinigri]|uniref:DNA-3-methyladenine glycosylase II n=1 Tax=Halopseudomonas sabulinigri TaxID=472181 RepID=A0ABP9ZKU1_9GAMM
MHDLNHGVRICTTLALPGDFRVDDVLRFYRRDGQQLAECVNERAVYKALLYRGVPSCLVIDFSALPAARISLHSDAPVELTEAALGDWAARLLGLTQPIESFSRCYAEHPLLGELLQANPGLRIPQAILPFEAACWAVIGQMISVEAATSIRRRLIQTFGVTHSSGLLCHPDAAILAGLDEAQLRPCGLSRSKVAALQLLAKETLAGQLPLEQTAALDTAAAQRLPADLLALRGIGPWTASYILLRGFGLLDGSLHGDVVVRKRLQRLLALEAAPDQRETAAWLATFSPYRALVAAHLWAMPSEQKTTDY